MPSLRALFNAERTSCQAFPRNSRFSRSTSVSSATCTCCQPSSRVTPTVAAVAEKTHGTSPEFSHISRNSVSACAAEPHGATGSPSAIATPAWRW